jgi:competence protein ComEC
MRPPIVQFTVAYAAGLWVGLVVSVPVVAVLVGVAGAGLAARWWRWPAILVTTFAVAALTGTVRHAAGRDDCALVWITGPQAVTVRMHDAPGPRGVTTASVLQAEGQCDGELTLRIDGEVPPPGARAVIVGAYRGRGVLRARHVRGLSGGVVWRYRLRGGVARRIRALYGERAGLVEALVLGRRDDIEPDLRTEFVDAGLAHLLAISGLHVGIAAGWIALGARALGAGHAAGLWSAALTWGYVALLGFPAPATRAAAFVTVFAASRRRQRHPPPRAVLAVAILVVLAAEPAAATAVGAWLSATAVAGTRAATELVPRRAKLRALWQLGAASAGATLATAPITAYAFGSVAPAGILSNLLAVPLAGLAVPGVFASLALGSVLAGGAGLALAGIEWVAAITSRLPGGHLAGPPGVAFALPWAAALAASVWLIQTRPSWVRVRRQLLVGAAAASWASAVLPALRAPRHQQQLTIHVLDVGQGDAIAVRTPHDRWVLVDAGLRTGSWDAGARVVVPFLRRRGVRSLDAVVVSHGDADHLGGIPAVLDAFPAGLLLEPGQPLPSALYVEHLAAVDAGGVAWRAARAGDTLVVDGVVFAVLHPTSEWMAGQLSPNENSVVVHVSYGCFDALLTGDAGTPVEALLAARVRRTELLKVGHHGSASATGDAWLDALRPRAAVISVGRNNTYGHPAAAVLARFAARGIPVFRTDRGGSLAIHTDGRTLTVAEGAEDRGRPVRCWLARARGPTTGSPCGPSRSVRLPATCDRP